MSVISKDLARKIAIKLTEKTSILVDNLKVSYQEFVTTEYEKQIPDEVKKCFQKHPDWFNCTSYIYFRGNGFNHENITGTRRVICNSTTSAHLTLTSIIADKIMSIKRKHESEKDKYENLLEETTQALLALKTYNNIRKELPQAIPYLPPPMSNALICNFDSLKNKLNKQPEVKKSTTII
jgi:hypothetical protein